MKRISIGAYQALQDALSSVTWFKRQFQTLLRTALRSHPELLAELNFDETKRELSSKLVQRLAAQEETYRDVTVQLMVDLSEMSRFSDIETLEEPQRRDLLHKAQAAVTELRKWTQPFVAQQAEKDRIRARQKRKAARSAELKVFSDELKRLKMRYEALRASDSPHQRGLDFETLLNELFELFDMDPRAAYNTRTEQIDGSFSFDTDDYLLEAKWQTKPVSREEMDVFAAKVNRKGKNALGLFVAVNGFSTPGLETFSQSTPFLAVDGADIFLVLDERIRLDDLIKAKRRHANETGASFLPAASIMNHL